ncbi:hypothetical protein EV361DRAFT_885054 [Lentinula raphanica]|nr:hypothetical protein EV361DRAFT_885054 [Lentinula raphanica]
MSDSPDDKEKVAVDLTKQTSDHFNAPDADIVVESSDNILFNLHKKNIECVTGDFLLAEMSSDSKEAVQLAESANILEMLFTCLYPRPFPSLEDLDFDTFMLLAEAAEKYQFFGMMSACRLQMKEILYPTETSTSYASKQELSSKRMQLLHFAVDYEVQDVIEELQVIMVDIPLSKLVDILPSRVYKPWSLYREKRLIQQMSGEKDLSSSKRKRPRILDPKPQPAATMNRPKKTARTSESRY